MCGQITTDCRGRGGGGLSSESYSLNWLGKSYARLLANQNVNTLLQADTTHNTAPQNANSQNLLIKGDNLEVLKHLANAYREQVKMIYIDPPYNTGGDGFVYADDRKFTPQQLSSLAGIDEVEAKRILDFTQAKSNSHSAWLTFMYPRLYIARELLRDDGVIFISIDDNEQAQLKMLCDEVFGEENFVGLLSVENNPKGRKNSDFISVSNDYCLIYAKSKENSYFVENIPKNISDLIEDENGNYIHKSGKRVLVGDNSFNKLVKNIDSDKHYSVYYDAKTKKIAFKKEKNLQDIDSSLTAVGYVRYSSQADGKFIENTYTQIKFQKLFDLGALEFKEDKIFEKNFNTNIRIKSVLVSREYDAFINGGSKKFKIDVKTTSAGQYLKEIFSTNEELFTAPKSVDLIKIFCTLFESDDFIILDFFAGSGTTAHAVMQLNAEDNGNRQFICVQLPETTDEKSEAHKAGYATIFDITRERITRAAAKIKADNPLFAGDVGFKLFETVPVFDGYLDAPDSLTPNLNLFNASSLNAQDLQNLLTTWAVQDGIALTAAVTTLNLAGYKAYQAGEGGRLLYFMHANLTLATIKALLAKIDDDASFTPKHLIVFGYVLQSKIQREMTDAIKQYNNRKEIGLVLDIRF